MAETNILIFPFFKFIYFPFFLCSFIHISFAIISSIYMYIYYKSLYVALIPKCNNINMT